MKVGAEPKKVAMLSALLVVAVAAFYFNVIATDEAPAPAPRPVAATPAAAAPAARMVQSAPAPARRAAGKVAGGEFRPRMGVGVDEVKPDPAKVDPALHLNLLAKLQEIEAKAAGRNLFQYGPPPPPPQAEKPQQMPVNVPKIDLNPPPPPAQPAQTGPAQPPPPPPPTPLTFKYYGLKTSRVTGQKLAFLLEGEEIIVVGENELVKQRYRVVRILPGSVVMEDVQSKAQQTINIEAQAAAGA